MVLPICASIAVFSCLHGNAPATAMHAMPFSRKKLYRSSVVSRYDHDCFAHIAHRAVLHRFYSAVTFIIWPQRSCLPGSFGHLFPHFFVYAVSTFAAVVAGSVVTHILLAMFFNGLLPITIYLVNRFMSAFLFGYSNSPLASYIFSPVSFERNNYISILLRWLHDAYISRLFARSLPINMVFCRGLSTAPVGERRKRYSNFMAGRNHLCPFFAFVATIILGFFIMNLGGQTTNLPPLLVSSPDWLFSVLHHD